MHVNRHAQMTNVMGASPRSRSMTVQIPQGQVLLCGYLWKVGGYFKTWHRRWCVFEKSRKITYREDKGKDVKGTVVLWNVRGLQPINDKKRLEEIAPPEICHRYMFQ